MREFTLIGVTPAGLIDPSIAIAAGRAGGIGVLDLQWASDEAVAFRAVASLSRAGVPCGIKLDPHGEPLSNALAAGLPQEIELVLLTPGERDRLRSLIQSVRRPGRRLLLEVTSAAEAELAEELELDGLVAKGHEAGGRVGEETTFILLQRLLTRASRPVYAHGGIGLHTAAACYVAGAAGVLLDSQLALTRESPLPESARQAVARMDGSETTLLGSDATGRYRIYARPGHSGVESSREMAALSEQPGSDGAASWRRTLAERVGWEWLDRQIQPLGQDAAFAAPLTARFRTVAGIFDGIRVAIDHHVRVARSSSPLVEKSPLARAHGTRYPILQGPMTRVSDRAAFAECVAAGGALPFLALALMRAPEVDALLDETARLLGDRPWGVGILGFVPPELRQEQIEVVRRYRPKFALIAGGRPEQARALERDGIATYLHVPSPELLRQYAEQGARRFVFEGRECGGHVGPRTSFVLWNTMIDTLVGAVPPDELRECHVVFAGGIHDARSASMVAALAAPLVEASARVGVLLGTAYLLTEEAVASGAILPGFQEAALRCERTALLETGPGHVTRCADTPFVQAFQRERERLAREGASPDAVRTRLEALNLGRLRLASKGVRRVSDDRSAGLVAVSSDEQRAEGMFMLGQAAALHHTVTTIESLHRDVSAGSAERLASAELPALAESAESADRAEQPSDVAIVGMACLLPGAPDLQTYWRNILGQVDAIGEVPAHRWDVERYFDPDPAARDRIYGRWGGFLDEIPFDPLKYGIPPSTLPSIEPLQLLTLEVVRAALEDAGYADRSFNRERTSVILGAGGGVSDLGQQYAVRSSLPTLLGEVPADLLDSLPEWTEDSFPGILVNVAAGRVANRFDFGGVNYTVDAACASSLAAVYQAVRELEIGSSDMVVVGGVDTVQNPFGYLCFSKTHALSPSGRCRTFDASADGIVISEGLAVLVLKRLADAERDGDRIYATIKAVAGSSDGRDRGLTAPRPEGQARALKRAYAKAGFSPASVGLIEAHGTGTVAGDRAELETLRQVFGAAGASPRRCAIGSVKSMIGHTKCTAGVAGLVKTALALRHGVLPPTLHVTQPNPALASDETPFYVNTEPRPWLRDATGAPRRAGVSAFGFGGTNFHAVLEEHVEAGSHLHASAATEQWPAELCLLTADSREQLATAAASLGRQLGQGARPELRDLAWALWERAKVGAGRTLAIVAASLDDLHEKLACAAEQLARPEQDRVEDPRGVYFFERPLAADGRIGFLFAGQGSQYPGMLRDLAVQFPELREAFETADRVLADRLPRALSGYVFPPPRFSANDERQDGRALAEVTVAQPALGAAEMGVARLLGALGLRADMAGGHSYGEYAALCHAGVFEPELLYELSEARGRCIRAAAGPDAGTMAAVAASRDRVEAAIASMAGVWIANVNAPSQTVISGTREGVRQAAERLRESGVEARDLPVACAFHSPIIAAARDALAEQLSKHAYRAPRLPVFGNASAAPYPDDPVVIPSLLAEHLVSPVRFLDQIEAMYRAGARIFVEIGPRSVLTGLTRQILTDRPHLAVATDAPNRPGLIHLLHALGQLAAHGVPLRLDRLYAGRVSRRLELDRLIEETQSPEPSPTTWLVDGGRARPLHQSHRDRTPAGASMNKDFASNGATGHSDNGASPSLMVPPAPNGYLAPAPGARESFAAPVEGDEAARVMLGFQQVMQRFLETQRDVMLAYLGGTPGGPALPIANGSQSAVLSPSYVPLPEPLPLNGHTTLPPVGTDPPAISQVGPPAEEPVGLAPGEQAARDLSPARLGSEPVLDRERLTQKLLEIASDRTGYPPDMLDLNADIEADLGIDSIKRVEILGAFRRGLDAAELSGEQLAEHLTGIKTFRGIVEVIHNLLRVSPVGSSPDSQPGEPGVAGGDRQELEPEHGVPLPRFVLKAVDASR